MKDFLPVIYPAQGVEYRADTSNEMLYNATPLVLHNQMIGACPRAGYLDTGLFVASAGTNRGRGLAVFGGEFDLYLDEDTYYYDGGSQDLTATTGNGYAGNTGFNEEYTASFVHHPVSGAENLVIVNAGHTSTHASAKHGNVWYTASASAAPSSISDADMPGNNGVSLARGGASLDGYLFVGDTTGKIFNSALNDITTWSATNFITNETEPDIGIYVGKHHDTVVSIGTRGIKFFWNAGNTTGTPLSPRGDVAYRVGTYFPNTVCEVGDIIYFLGVDHSGHIKVYMLQNFQLITISDTKLESKLKELITGTYPDITALDPLIDNAWMCFIFSNNSPGLILTYDDEWSFFWHQATNTWSRWAVGADPTHSGGILGDGWTNVFPIIASNNAGMGGGVGGASNSLSRYQFASGIIGFERSPSDSTMTDMGIGNAADIFMQFARWDGGTSQKKRINYVRILTQSVSDSSATYSPMNAYLKWFDFDRADTAPTLPYNLNNERVVSLNTRGARVARCGTTRERAFVLDWPDGMGPVSVVTGLEIDYEVVGE